MKYEIRDRLTGAVRFTAEIDCADDAPEPHKKRLAVLWALKNGANLSGANLSFANLIDVNLIDANLSFANLIDANLIDANLSFANLSGSRGIDDRIIDGGLRKDGYRFLLTRTEPGEWRIKAGCRNFTLSEATEHWARTRPHGDALGDETRLIINHMIAVAKLRNWPETGEGSAE